MKMDEKSQIIIESSKIVGKPLKLLEFSRMINDKMPIQCVSKSIEILKNNGKKYRGATIAILGLGFRGEVTDKRLSPTYEVVNQFLKYNCTIRVHDPYILEDDELPKSVKLSMKLSIVTKDADLIFIATDHKEYSKLIKSSFKNSKKPLLIFDGRNILNRPKFENVQLFTIGTNG